MKREMDRLTKKWYCNYIQGINTNNVNWKKMNGEELKYFIGRNYYDEKEETPVISRNLDSEGNSIFTVFGMSKLGFNFSPYVNYLVGFCSNKMGELTIVACVEYINNYIIDSLTNSVSYIRWIDINNYLRGNKRLLTQIANKLKDDNGLTSIKVISQEVDSSFKEKLLDKLNSKEGKATTDISYRIARYEETKGKCIS